jgi:hypothetical protein
MIKAYTSVLYFMGLTKALAIKRNAKNIIFIYVAQLTNFVPNLFDHYAADMQQEN